MPSHDWSPLARWLLSEIGYAIASEKFYLLDANVGALLAGRSPAQLVDQCTRDASTRQAVINAATINESLFFRDTSLWHMLNQRLLPELAPALSFSHELHVLCCACSRGQEVWSLAMTLAEHPLYAEKIRLRVHAVDIDTQVLAYAQEGSYSELEVSRGLEPARLARWFTRSGNRYRISDALRAGLTFSTLNLNSAFTFARRFDLVFCRNVLIYFQPSGKTSVLDRLAHYTNNHGFLILGGAETTLNLSNAWNPRAFAGYTVYEKRYR